jgi:sugar-specific transcriptional regulator TrmB
LGKYLKKTTTRFYPKRGLVTIQNDKMLDILMKLDLTELQAKTYLTLTRFDKAEVKKISEASKIARQDLYRIIPTLENLGLVEKIVATPILYRAIPLSEGTSSLFQKKSNEITSIKNNLEMLILQSEENSAVTVEECDTSFVITSERKRLVAKLEKAYAESETSDIMIPGHALNFLVFNFYECLSTALADGARIRVMVKKEEMRQAATQKLRNLKAYPSFEIRFVESPFNFGMAICNGREVNISISEKEVPSLWTNNPQIVLMSKMMFDSEWNAHTSKGPELICKNVADHLKVKQR